MSASPSQHLPPGFQNPVRHARGRMFPRYDSGHGRLLRTLLIGSMITTFSVSSTA